MEKNNLAIILPYFGKFPIYSDLFFESLRRNPNVDFLIFTDCELPYQDCKNIKITKTTLADIKMLFSTKLGRECSLENPYKLCDYKPMYGYCFYDYILDYEYWGYCDADMVFGDIMKFITPEILNAHDKIFARGHLTIYKNNEKMINMFRNKVNNINWEKIILSQKTVGFDEWKYIHRICESMGVKTFLEEIILDIDCNSFNMKRTIDHDKSLQTFFYKNGKIYMHKKGKDPVEYLYIHLQKRKIHSVNFQDKKGYIYFQPSQIVEYENIASSEKQMISINKWILKHAKIFYKEIYLRKFKNLLSKLLG